MADGNAVGGGTPPLEGLLAGLRLALGAGNAGEHRDALAGVADWPALASLAAHHRVGTLFLAGLRRGGVRLPGPAVAATLARQRQRDTLRGMRQLDAMERVTAGLAAADIPSLILKGLPLGQRLYGSPFAKSSIDIDLLVSEDAFDTAAGTLRALGWRRAMPAFRETPARMRWYDAVQKEHVYTGSGSTIELHRRLLSNRFLFDPPFDRLDARALTVAMGQGGFRTLGDADQLLYLACHGSVHYWQRLKWLCDIAGLLHTMNDESIEQAVARGRQGGLESLLAATLRLCREDLQVELSEALAALRGDGARVWFVAGLSRRSWTPREGLRRVMRKAAMRVGRVFLRNGVRYRLDEARGMLIRHHYFSTFDLPDPLFWLYLPLRPLLWGLRRLRRPRSGDSGHRGRPESNGQRPPTSEAARTRGASRRERR